MKLNVNYAFTTDLEGPSTDPPRFQRVRIVDNGNFVSQGRLEVWIRGRWSPVYDIGMVWLEWLVGMVGMVF